MDSSPVEFSKLDEERFGIKVAKTNTLTFENINEIIEICTSNQVALLIARCPVVDIRTVHAMEENGFLLMDTLISLRLDLENYQEPEQLSEVTIRPFKPGEEQQISDVAGKAFTGYYGHYHADPRLNPESATAVYRSWAERCCNDPTVADSVLVAELDGQIVGFRADRINSQGQGQFILTGVNPEFQRRGIYRSLVLAGIRRCKILGAKEIINSTHLANVAVQKVCNRLGFILKEAHHTFHKWFL